MLCLAMFLKIDIYMEPNVRDAGYAGRGRLCYRRRGRMCNPGHCVIHTVGVFVRVSSPTETQTDRPR